ncbi:hypothetical protein BH23ACT4_BH23ACT4_03600 [soil metagenome]
MVAVKLRRRSGRARPITIIEALAARRLESAGFVVLADELRADPAGQRVVSEVVATLKRAGLFSESMVDFWRGE